MDHQTPILVFADVDCVLGHPSAQAYVEAGKALGRLDRGDAPLVLCSNRTRAEVEHIQQQLGMLHPFVCESGGAIFVPARYFSFEIPSTRDLPGYAAVEFGRPHQEVVEALHRTAARQKIEIIGFSEMSVEQVARECDMPLLQARLAKLRHTERFRPIDATGATRERLERALESAGLRCLRGDRFHQVGVSLDSSAAIGFIHALYRRAFGSVLTLGLGEATPDGNALQFFNRRVDVRGNGDAGNIVGWAEKIVEGVEQLRQCGSLQAN